MRLTIYVKLEVNTVIADCHFNLPQRFEWVCMDRQMKQITYVPRGCVPSWLSTLSFYITPCLSEFDNNASICA